MFPRVKVICARALHQVSAKDVEDILTCPTHSWLDQVTLLTLITYLSSHLGLSCPQLSFLNIQTCPNLVLILVCIPDTLTCPYLVIALVLIMYVLAHYLFGSTSSSRRSVTTGSSTCSPRTSTLWP